MLQHLGYQVTGMTGSRAALAYFEEHPTEIDLVITDLTMPQMTGDLLAGKLLQRRPNLPIILLTGFAELITEEKVRATGIRAMAFKPVVMNELATLVRRVLDV
jgi:CheY-like chemotaxis protein